MTWLLPDIYLGVDSLVVSAAVAPLVPERSSRLLLATLFGGFDALATVLGASQRWQLPEGLPQYVPVGLVCLYGVYICPVVYWGGRAIARWPIWVMPMLCSLDNHSYGITAHRAWGAIVPHAALSGMISAGMAGLGMIAARTFSAARRREGPGRCFWGRPPSTRSVSRKDLAAFHVSRHHLWRRRKWRWQ